MNAIDETLQALPFWKNLTEDDRQLARSGASLREYGKGQFIHGGANDCLGMIYLISGEIRTYIVSEEGREITLFRLFDGDTCVFSASCAIRQLTFETVIVAEKDCKMLIISTGYFSRLTERNIYARCFVYELITERFSTVMWTMQEIIFKGFDRRLASFLVAEYERTGSNEIHLTHEQIAQRVSSAREVVARMLKRFNSEGMVQLRRGEIRIEDIKKLRELM